MRLRKIAPGLLTLQLASLILVACGLAPVGQLAAGIAHEVRNPLAILRATAQLLAGRLTED